MDLKFDAPKPSVKVYYDSKKNFDKILEQVLLGIEEEGVPYEIKPVGSFRSTENLAYQAAESSRLGVGIGLGDKVILHYIKLHENEPLFVMDITNDEQKLRDIGSNAARLVKGMPFKVD